jgi:choice-of-anchor B domain-containing protein
MEQHQNYFKKNISGNGNDSNRLDLLHKCGFLAPVERLPRFVAVIFFLIISFGYTPSTFAQFSKNITLAGHLPYNTCLSALWGYTDPQGNEYAIVGTCAGTSIVDITNPATPQEKYFVPGPTSIWREMKTWDHYAYIVTEGGNGITIVDLANLPDTNLSYTIYQNTGVGMLTNVHTIWIDENGICYLFGATGFNSGMGEGCVILDLKPNPMNPTFVGTKNGIYYHDGFVRGDTLWGSAIYNGYLEVYDMSDPLSPQFLGNRNTPGNFTHNAWLSDDGKTIFTTDEVPDACVTSYDVTDLHNIKELDRVQMDPAGNEVPHNVHYLKGWLPTAYYREGAVIIDAHRPENMVVTGYYDTSFPDTGNAFDGVWEVYPFFPSGRMIAGDRQNGLFILNPTYVRAAYLEGTVTDTATGLPISGASVFFSGLVPGDTLLTSIDGSYKTGAADSGLYVVTFAKDGYEPKKFYVTLKNAEVVIRNAALRPIGYIPPPPQDDFSDLLIWPVPASSTMEIKGIPLDVKEVSMADVNGKIVYTKALNANPYITLDVSIYAAGGYFLYFIKEKKKEKVVRVVIGN